MARELGADERYVALSQYLRLTIVVLTMPMVLGALGTRDTAPVTVAAHDHWNIVGLLGMAALDLRRRLAPPSWSGCPPHSCWARWS